MLQNFSFTGNDILVELFFRKLYNPFQDSFFQKISRQLPLVFAIATDW